MKTDPGCIIKKFPFAKFLLNSVIVAVSSVGLNTLVTTMAGYSFARIDFKGKEHGIHDFSGRHDDSRAGYNDTCIYRDV